MEDKELQRIFSKLKKVEAAPSSTVWNRLESELKSHKTKRFQRIFNYSVAAALLLLFGVVFTHLYNRPEMSQPTAQEVPVLQKDSLIRADSVHR